MTYNTSQTHFTETNTLTHHNTPPTPPNTPTLTPITILTRPKMNTKFLTKQEGDLTMKYSKRNEVIDGFKYIDGVIMDNNNTVVCPGLHKMAEITVSADNYNEIMNHNFFNNQSFENIEQHVVNDGTMIRLFYHNGEWKKATNRRINADSASYGSVKSFGFLFDNSAEFYSLNYDNLDKDYSYYFVMNHPENRIIEPITSFPILHHIDTVHVQTGESVDMDIGIQKDIIVHYKSLKEMMETLNNPETPWMFQGFLLINSRNERLKLENPQYTHIRNIKGNIITETNKWKMKDDINPYNYRILQIVQEDKESEFLQYFNEHVQAMINIKEDIFNLSKRLWDTYRERFIFKNKNFHQSPELQTFLNYLHYQYHTTHQAITFKKCFEAVKNCPTTKLMHSLGYINYK